jgi:hypothetical protein
MDNRMTKQIFNEESPVFVCGASRSGTTMVSKFISSQTEHHIVRETHYFDDLRVRFNSQLGETLGRDDQKVCEDYFLALTHRPYGHQGDPERADIVRSDLADAALELGGCPDSYFVAFCKLQMNKHHGNLWGEKTPRHVMRLSEILDVFPNGRVIYMLRDPRGVVASYRDWKNQGGFDLEADPEHRRILQEEERRTRKSYHPVICTLLWKASYRAARSAQKLHGENRIRIQKYETLCNEPDTAFVDLFDWIGAEGKPDLSRMTAINSSYDHYKEQGGVQSAPTTRWREKLSPREVGLVECVCGKTLEEAGYQPIKPRVSIMTIGCDLASTAPAVFRAVRANMSRSGNIVKYVAHRARLAFR